MRALLLAITLFVSACSGCNTQLDYTPLAHQDDAVKLVWYGLYGNMKAPPPVGWRDQNTLDCFMVNGHYLGFYRADQPGGPAVERMDHCVAGVTWDPGYTCEIARDQDFTFAKGAWPHEMWHATLQNLTGWGDPYHVDGGFMPGGIVDQAHNLLAEHGL